MNDKEIMYVEWIDAESHDSWSEWERLPETVPTIYSIGFIIKETDDMLVIALNVDPRNKTASCAMLIPKKFIIKKRKIKDVKKRKA